MKNKPPTLADLDEVIKQWEASKPRILLMSERTQRILQTWLDKLFRGT